MTKYYDRPVPLAGHELGYLAGLVRMDIRKLDRKIGKFAPFEGQDPAEAAAILEHWQGKQEFHRRLLAKLTDKTGEP